MVSAAVKSTMVKFILFFSLNIFYFPVIVSSVLGTALESNDFGIGLVEKFVEMGNFYLVYLTTMLFVSNGFLILQPGRYIISKIKDRNSATPKENAFAWSNTPFDVPY